MLQKKKYFLYLTTTLLATVLSAALISTIIDRGASVSSTEGKTIPVPGPWEYRWGDSPGAALAAPQWIMKNTDSSKWIPLKSPSEIPGKKKSQIIWVRTRLPEALSGNNHLYLQVVLEVFEVYMNRKLLYRFGSPDISSDENKFHGWPWHLIALPADSGGEFIYFRIYSSHRKIGIFGPVTTGNKSAIIVKMITGNIEHFVLACIFLFMGLFLIVIFLNDLQNDTRMGYLSLGIFSILAGLFFISRAGSDIKQLIENNPLLWSHIEMISLYFLPTGIMTYIQRVVDYKKLISITWKLQLGSAIITIILLLTGMVSLTSTIPFHMVSFLICIAVIITSIIQSAARGNRNARFLLIICSLLALTAINDILLTLGIIRYTVPVAHWGTLILILSLAFTLGTRYSDYLKKFTAVEQELSLAENIQKGVLTDISNLGHLKNFEIDSIYRPFNSKVGGDYYNIQAIDSSSVSVMLADATDHGLHAALLTMQIDIMNSQSIEIRKPHNRLLFINNFFAGYKKSVTIFPAFIMNISKETIEYSAAGLHQQFLISPARNKVIALKCPGRIAGFMKNSEYILKEEKIYPNDIIFLFTDGIIDETTGTGKRFGTDGVTEFLESWLEETGGREPLKRLNSRLLSAVRSFTGRKVFNDDITVISIRKS